MRDHVDGAPFIEAAVQSLRQRTMHGTGYSFVAKPFARRRRCLVKNMGGFELQPWDCVRARGHGAVTSNVARAKQEPSTPSLAYGRCARVQFASERTPPYQEPASTSIQVVEE